jgi:hypothetical protein
MSVNTTFIVCAVIADVALHIGTAYLFYRAGVAKPKPNPVYIPPNHIMPNNDPERIAAVLETVEAYWRKYPSLRLGQLITNAATSCNNIDPFYIPDAMLVHKLKN